MTGRGVDQILPHPSDPRLYESYVRSAVTYVELAESVSGPIRKPVDFPYIWGDALAELERVHPDARIVNLETSVTVSEDAWPQKGIHYRMQPANVACLSAARLDCCVLANNHVMDWGRAGLIETLSTLHAVGMRTVGAGRDATEAATPAVIELGASARVLVFAFGTESSGVPFEWGATATRSGVSILKDLSVQSIEMIADRIARHRRSGDVVVVSLHWGGNWGYAIAPLTRNFAHGLIDAASVDVVHGHSSHHVKGIEVYRDKPIVYGCGDFLTDYEGIGGHESYRGDLSLMYFPVLERGTGRLLRFKMTPMRMRHMRVNRAQPEEAAWLAETLNREGKELGSRAMHESDGTIALAWI
jgi:poly-gamma-glutamate synthesis protein (capsule biosynthesis protein)